MTAPRIDVRKVTIMKNEQYCGKWRAFEGANGWYCAWESADGYHCPPRPWDHDRIAGSEQAARKEAADRNEDAEI